MAEELHISTESKTLKYQSLLPQLRALTTGEPNLVANLANLAAALRQTFNWFWVGFYLVEDDQLVLGPFQGDIACTRIAFGKGVCGTAWEKAETIIVPDVSKFNGHITCSPNSKSEIVVPVLKDGKVRLVLDIDSDQYDEYDEIDKEYLESLAEHIATLL